MRISDWSSDVCSSDLLHEQDDRGGQQDAEHEGDHLDVGDGDHAAEQRIGAEAGLGGAHLRAIGEVEALLQHQRDAESGQQRGEEVAGDHPLRSEEHTSELQSLMRSSYAVFCLKKKKASN